MSTKKIPLVIIAGPTGVGKTAASIEIANRLNGEIICCDSMQIYKGMDIGTAKITPKEACGVPHHLVDIVSPRVNFSVCNYVEKCKIAINDIVFRGKLPIMVGGTGLYIDSVIDDIDFEECCTDMEYRAYLEQLCQQQGCEYVHKMLLDVDPESGQTIHANNIKRVIRALEYYKVTGRTISEHNKMSKQKESPYDYCYFCFTRDREELYSRIDMRVDDMLSDGLVNEVDMLLKSGLNTECTAMQAIGYKEVAEYINGKVDYTEMTETLKRNSRRYAKRQLTWFRRRADVCWINISEMPDYIGHCIEYIERKIIV